MTNIRQITPVLNVPDLDTATDFFEHILGAKISHKGGGYAYVDLGGHGIRLMTHAITEDTNPGNRRYGCYVDVADVDALYAELKDRLARLPFHDVHGPADKPYGQRELIVLAPDGNHIVFGQSIA